MTDLDGLGSVMAIFVGGIRVDLWVTGGCEE